MKGRRAVLPPRGAATPPTIQEDGLVAYVVPEGTNTPVRIDLSEWPGDIELRRQTLAAICHLAGPLGSWRATATLETGLRAVKPLTSWCADSDIQDLSSLTVEHWSGEHGFMAHCHERSTRPHTRRGWIGSARRVLESHRGLRPALRTELERTLLHSLPPPQVDHYSREELDSLRKAAQKELAAAERRVSNNYRLVYADPADLPRQDVLKRTALIEILDHGVPQTCESWKAVGAWRGYGQATRAQCELFLTTEEGFAAATVLALATGENLSTLRRRTVADSTASAGDEDLTVFSTVLDKPRRGKQRRHMAENAVDSASAPPQQLGPALRRVHRATEPARDAMRRREVADDDRLIVWMHRNGQFTSGLYSQNRARYASRWLPDGLRLDFAKLHRSVLTRQHRMPTHNTLETFLSSYVLLDPARRAELEEQVEAGLTQLVARARSTPLMQLLPAGDASSVRASNDTAVAACSDHSHHPDTGKACVVNDFLVCLGCSNGVATDRHLPILVALFDELERLRQLPALPQQLWDNRFALHWARLCLILRDISPAQWDAARATQTFDDCMTVQEVLTGRGWEL